MVEVRKRGAEPECEAPSGRESAHPVAGVQVERGGSVDGHGEPAIDRSGSAYRRVHGANVRAVASVDREVLRELHAGAEVAPATPGAERGSHGDVGERATGAQVHPE